MSKYSINQLARNVTRKFDFEKFKRVIFINTGDVLNNEFLHQNVSSKNSLPGQAKKAIKKGDILYSEIRPGNGRYLLVEKDLDNYVVSTKFMVIEVNKELVLPEYLYLILTSQEVVSYFKVIAESRSGTFPQITFDSISHYSIDLPNLEIQKEIIDIVFAFNKKIQLNTQINQTLEQIAQSIFKSWFIDFDPVKAKAEAKAQGATDEQANIAAMSVISGKSPDQLNAYKQTNPTDYQQLHQLAQAFPSEFEDIDGVEVPKGWGIEKLPEIIDFLEGPGIRNWQYTDAEDGINFINIRCIQNGDLSLSSANKISKEEAFGKYAHFQLKENDIVISTSGTLGRFAIVRQEHLPLCLNTSVIRFRPIENKSTLAFIYGFVNNQLQYELETRASGSVQKNFGPTHLKSINMLVPNFELLKLHNDFMSHFFEKRKANLKEIEFLERTRDLLLPKLLSGEVGV